MKPGTPERLNLFINKIVITKTELDEKEISKIIDEICSKSTDWEETDSYQYEKLNLDLDEGSELSIRKKASKMHVIRYWYDELASKTKWLRVYDKGKLERKARQGKVVIFHPSDLIWLFPDFIAIRGAESDVDTAFDKFKILFSDRVKFESFTLSPMFLFWVWRKWATHGKNGEAESPVSISTGLKVRRIRAVVALGIKSRTGGRVSIDEMETKQSIPLLHTLLSGKGISEIDSYFELETGHIILARLISTGIIRIRIAGSIQSSDMTTEKLVKCTMFIEQILKCYIAWQKLPKNQRNPPKKVYDEIKETIQARWNEIVEDDEEIRKTQESKSGF